jgi:hypothetical protein
MAVGRVHDIDGVGRRLPVRQQRHQRAAVDVRPGGVELFVDGGTAQI